jgi:hypothetical protein
MRISVKNRRGSLRIGLVAAGAAVAVAAGTVAWGDDTVFPDGDTGVASPNLAYGSGANDHACASRGTAVSGEITVNYNGNGLATTKHFSPNESLTVSYAPPLGSGITVTPGTVPDVPATWGSSPGDNFKIPFTTTVPAITADGSYGVEVTVTGDTSGYSAGAGPATPGKPKFPVMVHCAATAPANTAPSVAFSSPPASATEGDVKAYSFAITDPDAGQTFSYAAGSPSCGSLGSVSGTPTIDSTAKTGTFSCSFPDGLVPATDSTVSVQVTDGTDLSNTATTKTTVNNANPVVGALTLGGNTGTACLAGKTVTLDFGFSDLGVNDTPWGIDVNWGNGSTPTYSVATQGDQTQLSHLYAGAGSWTVGVTVTDKDTGPGSNSSATGAVSFLYSTGQGILQPINYTGPRSSFKIGSTIPVKIKITDCVGTPISGLAPQVSLKYVDGTPDGVAVEDFYSTVPDQGTSMRYTGSPDYQYIYNLGTKGRSAGDYSVTVSDPTIAPVTAGISMKK